jgi:hypothetical protein
MGKKDVREKVGYLVFMPGYDRKNAIDEFRRQFGRKPKSVTEDHNHLWLGPIPEMSVEEE